jgi:DNA-binding phage protein
MPEENQAEVTDRRAVLEAAFDAAAAAPEPEQKTAPVTRETLADSTSTTSIREEATIAQGSEKEVAADTAKPTETDSSATSPATEATAKPDDSKDLGATKPLATERAPQSWKAGTKAKWSALDPEVKQEVMRREVETTRVLNETAAARQFVNQFSQAIQPYHARIKAVGQNPLAAIGELFQADYILSSAPTVQRAAYMAKLIKDYGIDITALDEALSGQVSPQTSQTAQVEALLQQRLAPLQQFLVSQQQVEAQRQQETAQQAQATIEAMATDSEKYPFFEEVRETMADLIEFESARRRPLTIEAAYNRAVAMDSTLNQRQQTLLTTERAAKAAAEANAKAQQALAASVSVKGAPGGVVSKSPSNDRRATIEAAWNSLGGR